MAEDESRYFVPTWQRRDLGLYCLGVGDYPSVRAKQADRTLSCYAAILVHSGSGELCTARMPDAVPVSSPALFWLHPGVAHQYGPGADGWGERWVLFDGSAARAYSRLGYLDPASPVSSADPRRTVALMGAICQAGLRRRPPDDIGVVGLIHQLITGAAAPTRPVSSDAVRTALENDAVNPGTIRDRAQRLGIAPAELRSGAADAAGETPHEVVIRSRLERAKQMLAHTSRPIAQISREIGYADAAYFSRLFHRRVGMSPRQFRRQQSRTLESAWSEVSN